VGATPGPEEWRSRPGNRVHRIRRNGALHIYSGTKRPPQGGLFVLLSTKMLPDGGLLAFLSISGRTSCALFREPRPSRQAACVAGPLGIGRRCRNEDVPSSECGGVAAGGVRCRPAGHRSALRADFPGSRSGRRRAAQLAESLPATPSNSLLKQVPRQHETYARLDADALEPCSAARTGFQAMPSMRACTARHLPRRWTVWPVPGG
jgi:hypothetical protein